MTHIKKISVIKAVIKTSPPPNDLEPVTTFKGKADDNQNWDYPL